MARRAFLLVLAATLVTLAVLAITACSSSVAGTTTTQASTPTTGSPTTSPTGGVATTVGAATTADTAAQDGYKAKMSAWVTGPLKKLDTSVFNIPDPGNATSAQIDAVAAFVSQAGAALDRLKAIKPSAEAVVPHNQFVKAYEDLLAATDKYVTAMRTKNASELPTIEQAISTAQGEIQQSVGILAPMIGLTPPSS